MAIQTTLTLPNQLGQYYDKRMLDRLMKNLVFMGLGQKKPLPQGNGVTINFERYANLAALTSALTEGVVPTSQALTSSRITATVQQYGGYVQISDLLDLVAIDPVIESAVDLLGYQASLSIDTLIRNQLDANGTDQYANGAVNEAAITGADIMSATEIRKAVRSLKGVDAKPIRNGDYAFVIHPYQGYDLKADTAAGGWMDITKYVDNMPILNGEIGKIDGAIVIESSNVSFLNNGTTDVYYAHMLADGAFGVVELSGGNLRTYVKTHGSSGAADPIDQISSVGWKITFTSKVLDNARNIIVKSAVS